jgi:acyl-CoA thioesterase II
MSNFVNDTAVEASGNGHYKAKLSKRWKIWGPNGGYVAAIALRAAGSFAPKFNPVSFSCQYLNVAEFDTVDIQVTPLKEGSRATALRVTVQQNDTLILTAHIWLTMDTPGYEHTFKARPSNWQERESTESNDDPNDYGYKFWNNFKKRPVTPIQFEKTEGREPQFSSWYRFEPDFEISDAFIDAARSLVLIDTLQWPAVYQAYGPGEMEFIAPSLDLNVQFHRSGQDSPWLYCDAHGDIAHRGLIAGSGTIWNENGQILASGCSQSLCRKL